MKKKDPRNIYDLALSEIFETESIIDQKLPNFMMFMDKKNQMTPGLGAKKVTSTNQTWSIPERTYMWFPYYILYVTSK